MMLNGGDDTLMHDDASTCENIASNIDIDENLYSRQLYVMGHEAMHRMAQSSVLLVGLQGVGMEIAKNIILAGVKSVFLLDDELVRIEDLGACFYFSSADVGIRQRSEACHTQLASLNRYVHVEVITGDVNESLLRSHSFSAAVITNRCLSEQICINETCFSLGIAFVSCEIFGVVGHVFSDFGDDFAVSDVDGEQPLQGMISNITQCEQGIITVYDEHRHGLSTGDFVVFDEVIGMTQLNNSSEKREGFCIHVINPYSFAIGDTRSFSPYQGGGTFTQVKKGKSITFSRLGATLEPSSAPLVIADYGKELLVPQLHVLLQALHQTSHSPSPDSWSDANSIVESSFSLMAKDAKYTHDKSFRDVLMAVARCAGAQLSPMASVVGGIAAQEIIKATSGKFMPLLQHLYIDAIEALPKLNIPPANENILKFDEQIHSFRACNSRYDAQLAVFGSDIQHKIAKSRAFLVGAGAIGCEMLKILALMGLATASEGNVCVTDMDTIEKSNLNRQFLFRPADVGQRKSYCAVQAAIAMNKEFRATAHDNRVGVETEHVYDDEFWNSLTFVCTALDNIDARMYVDSRCVYFQKAMLESGTSGTKGNSQIVIPFMTESYGATRDPPDESIPICTLKNFPNKIEHTIQWARDLLAGRFVTVIDDVNNYLSEANFLSALASEQNQEIETLRSIHEYLVKQRPMTFQDCIIWARLMFEEEFRSNIRQLLYNFPSDSLTSSGAAFWSGPKRAPEAIIFNPQDELHFSFIVAAANLRAFNYGLAGCKDSQTFHSTLSQVKVPEFVVKKGLHIKTSDDEHEIKKKSIRTDDADDDDDDDDDDRAVVKALINELPLPASLAGYRLIPVEFEKDDDSNHHMAFITACSNLRARNYRIKEKSLHETKRIAGKILPAIATTTSLVTGLISLELYKVLQNLPIESMRNSFVNLSLPLFSVAEPVPPTMTKTLMKGKECSWSIWDRIDIDIGDVTLKQLIKHFSSEIKLDIEMLSYGPSLLYAFFNKPATNTPRLEMKMSTLVETVTKQALNSRQQYLVLEACVTDTEGNDVEIPYIRMKFRK